MSKQRISKKRTVWNVEAIKLFIEIWRERFDELRSARRNFHIYGEMAEAMTTKGNFNYTAVEVKTKLHNMVKRYKSEQKFIASHSSPSEWLYFNEINELMQTNHAVNIGDYLIEPYAWNEDKKNEIYDDSNSLSSNLNSSPPPAGSKRKHFQEKLFLELIKSNKKMNENFQKFLKLSEEHNLYERERDSTLTELLRSSIEIQKALIKKL